MNEVLRLTLFGSPQILVGDQPLTGFATNKAQALLFYLAVTTDTAAAQPTPHGRDVIATLLWGEMTDAQAKQNLRTVLPDLRRLVANHLRIDRQTIAFDHTSPYWLDVEVFRRSLTPRPSPIGLATRQAAIDLYQGEFLSGFFVNNAPDFDAWVQQQREQLHILAVDALFALVNEHTQRADYAAALAANRRLLLLEPWSEPAHRQQMLLLAQTGERAAALAQYETCRHVLAAEFGIEPLPETTTLYEQIRTDGSSLNPPAAAPAPVTGLTRQAEPPSATDPEVMTADAPSVRVVGYNLPQRTKLYGRHAELASLRKWISEEGCRLVGIFGIGGQGKTALAAALVHTLAEPVPQAGRATGSQLIIWQSLLNAPPLTEVMQEWFYVLSEQMATSLPTSLDQQFSQLLDYLRRHRCLLILDNLESILQSDENSGHFRSGYEAYGQLIHHLAEDEHQSCLLLTSRERPRALTHLEEETPAVRTLTLAGLPTEAGRQLLQGRGLDNNPQGVDALVQHYSGNPLALKLVAETVHEIFDGDIAAFLKAETLVFDDIRYVLDQQFARLTPLERALMLWLAILREPVPFHALRNLLAQPPAPRLLLEAVRSLQGRSLLEKHDGGYGLQNVVLEYSTELLIENIGRELLDDMPPLPAPEQALSHLNAYPLILAQVKEYVRASQTRLLLQPVAERLLAQLGSKGAAQQLQNQLAHLRVAPAPGYAAANLFHLLLHLGVNLRGADFSQLYLRQLCLRGVSLPQTNFAQAEIVDSTFSEPFGLVYAVAFSPDGQYLAAGMSEGAIYLWRTADQQLVQVIRKSTQAIRQLVFAQPTTARSNEHLVLTSISNDRSLDFWSLAVSGQVRRHLQLSPTQQGELVSVGLHPAGQRVISVNREGQVFVWDVNAQPTAQLVQHFATHPTGLRLVAFQRDGEMVAIGNREGWVQLWQIATGEAGPRLVAPTGLLWTLAWSADGHTLVTGSKEGQLCLWTLPEGQLHQVLETWAGSIDALAFSADGKLLASSHTDRAVRLWAIDSQCRLQLCHTLLGHTQVIWSVAFGPQPVAHPDRQAVDKHTATRQLLVSSSSDQTVRVWDAETGQAIYLLTGQPRALAAHAIGRLPTGQGWVLAAAGYDRLVHVWQGYGVQVDAMDRVLHGSSGPLFTVAISPDGRSVAGAGHDRTIYLWDIASGQLRQHLQGHTNIVFAIAFHPNGELLASCSSDGTIRLWDLSATGRDPGRAVERSLPGQALAVLHANANIVFDVAFSPDGHMLASASTDSVLQIWDMTQNHYPELVAARRMMPEEGAKDIWAIAFSPDGAKLACGCNHLLHLWDLRTGEAPLILRQHSASIYGVAFSPDGATLASSSADCTICLWDVASGVLRAILRGHREIVYKVAFTPDGAFVVSCSFDGSIKFWDSQTGECLNTLAVVGPYAEMNITGVTGITEAQKAALKALGAVEMQNVE